MNTLYITDLDGTLLTPDGEISERSLDIINTLLDEGMPLTFATARTASTGLQILKDVHAKLPVLFMNGVAVYDMAKGEYLEEAELSDAQVEQSMRLLEKRGEPAFVYSIQNNQLICYSPEELTHEMARFRRHREERYSKVFTDFDKYTDLIEKKIIYIISVGSNLALAPAYRDFSNIAGLECLFYEDVYEDDWFLEIHRKGVSKGTAALALKESLGLERLVVFGDNLNDMPMFYAADYAYAMENGKDQILREANQIIGPNTKDSVAEELWKIWREKKHESQ